SMLMKLKQAGVGTVLVHHGNKNNETYRGASALATTFDSIIGLKKTRQAKIDHKCNFELFFEKSREEGSEAIESKNFRLVNSNPDNPDEGVVWIAEAAEDAFGERLIQELETLKYKNQAELAKGMGVTQSAISKHLTR